MKPIVLAALAAAAFSPIAGFAAATDAEAMAQESWRQTIARQPVPEAGCFLAEYPSANWVKTECVVAPDRVYMPREGARAQTVGNGHDYAAGTGGITTSAIGTFPVVTGVTSERDGGANVYSVQLNSNFMPNSAACTGISGCMAWEQFVYSSSERQAFMQYWLINYGTCPSGWNSFSGSCWKNSAGVSVPKLAITTLSTQKLSGTAVANGIDTLVFSAGTKAYSTTGPDSVTFLAAGWNQSEFNIIGDGGGSSARFNKGASMTVNVEVHDGTTNAPTCIANGGTTGETNNLNLGACTSAGGSAPHISFTQSD